MILLRVAVVGLLVVAAAGPAAAQGYGEQRTLQFRLQGADHTTQEVYRYQNSTAAIAAKKADRTLGAGVISAMRCSTWSVVIRPLAAVFS